MNSDKCLKFGLVRISDIYWNIKSKLAYLGELLSRNLFFLGQPLPSLLQ